MILQALYDYYQRKASDPENGVAPEGFGYKEIPFLIHITGDGSFAYIEDTRRTDGKRLVGRTLLVPVLSVTKTSGKIANLLWDNAKYCLGLPDPGKIEKIHKDWEKREKELLANGFSEDEITRNKIKEFEKPLSKVYDDAKICFSLFVKKIEEQNFSKNLSIQALLCFLKNDPVRQIEQKIGNKDEIWDNICSKNPNVSFWVDNEDEPLVSSLYTKISENYEAADSDDLDYQGICLITGEKSSIKLTHPVIKNVKNAQSSGAAIISFNNPSFTSFNKEQNLNAPVTKSAAFAYTTALNSLLDKKSKNKMQIGEMTMIFWSEKQTYFENFFAALWDLPPKDNPDADIEAVKQLYNSIIKGSVFSYSDTRFYILGLSPNAARLSVRFWHNGSLGEISQKIKQYFDDLRIIQSSKDKGHYALMTLLKSLVREIKDIPPNLNGEMMKSAIQGTRYPQSILQLCLRRIRTDFDPDPYDERIRMRAALLKAFLNRNCKTADKEITMSLDTTNKNKGYLLGRLFATLEKLQEEAQGGNLNSTIKDRYYGAASSTPCTVFPQLFKLKNFHLAKLSNLGRKTNFEKLIGEITDGIPSEGIPAHLNLDDQARFAIGYYHQRQDFFKSKEEK